MASLESVLRLTGVTYRQLDYWSRQGYIGGGCPGTGHVREWTMAEVRVIEKMVRLVSVGISPRVAEQVARGQSNIGHGVTVTIA